MGKPAIDLDALIAQVERQRPAGPVLDQLAEAVAVGDRVHQVADELVGHFVQCARTAGESWADIGYALGVSKQAVQKRFSVSRDDRQATRERRLQDRFTERARRVNERAQDEARRARHDHVGTEHLVLALLTDTDCQAARAIQESGVSLEQAQRVAAAAIARPGESLGQDVRFTAGARKARGLALREAKQLGRDDVGTEHLLLGVLREAGAGARILQQIGVTRRQVEQWIAAQAGGEDL